MALVLDPVQNTYDNTSTINANFQAIVDELEKKLARAGVQVGQANEMQNALDMNSNKIINVFSDPNDPDSLLTVGEAVAWFLGLNGGTMSGDINMGGNKITNFYTDLNNADSMIKVGQADSRYVNATGDTMSGTLSMGGNKISSLQNPSADTDAATKFYVDAIFNEIIAGTLLIRKLPASDIPNASTYDYVDDEVGTSLKVDTGDSGTPSTIVLDPVTAVRPSGDSFTYNNVSKGKIYNIDGFAMNPVSALVSSATFGEGLGNCGNIFSQSCGATFARAVNIASIFSSAEGNLSANIASRLSKATIAQAVNIGSEDCDALGDRTSNLSQKIGYAEGVCSSNIAGRRSRASGNDSGNFATDTCLAGNGWGAKLEAVVVAGVITAINVINGGEGYEKTPSILIQDKTTSGSGAVASANVIGGVIDSITVTNGGSGYDDSQPYHIVIRAEVEDQQVANIASLSAEARGETSGNFASDGSRVGAERSANIASLLNRISASENSATLGGNNSEIDDSIGSAIVASSSSRVDNADNSAVVACENSKVFANVGNIQSSSAAILRGFRSTLYGRNVLETTNNVFSMGYSATPLADEVTRANVTIRMDPVLGRGYFNGGTFNSGADFAELFENGIGEVALRGRIMTIKDGKAVYPTSSSDHIVGVISSNPAVVGNAHSEEWHRRYETDEFGDRIKVGVDDEGYSVYKERDDYDRSMQYAPRMERPLEWSCIGLVGQLPTVVDTSVKPGQYVNATGMPTQEKTKLLCMRKISDTVAMCLIG